MNRPPESVDSTGLDWIGLESLTSKVSAGPKRSPRYSSQVKKVKPGRFQVDSRNNNNNNPLDDRDVEGQQH